MRRYVFLAVGSGFLNWFHPRYLSLRDKRRSSIDRMHSRAFELDSEALRVFLEEVWIRLGLVHERQQQADRLFHPHCVRQEQRVQDSQGY